MEVGYSRLHNWHHDDYELAKEHIYRQIGDLSSIRLFGRQVLCAIYMRPRLNPRSKLECTDREQAEDIAQGKCMLIVQAGPSAFDGSEEYIQSMYGVDGAPKVGDWVFARAAVGEPTHMCLDGAEIMKYEDRRGEEHDAYVFKNGWPCRVLTDEQIIGYVAKPHQVV